MAHVDQINSLLISSSSGNKCAAAVNTNTKNGINSNSINCLAITNNQNSLHPKSNKQEYIPISQFYTDRSVFITGGTGFMGKVLVEKLLRSCTGIKNIYLLIRPKRGQEVAARLNDLLNAPVRPFLILLFILNIHMYI